MKYHVSLNSLVNNSRWIIRLRRRAIVLHPVGVHATESHSSRLILPSRKILDKSLMLISSP